MWTEQRSSRGLFSLVAAGVVAISTVLAVSTVAVVWALSSGIGLPGRFTVVLTKADAQRLLKGTGVASGVRPSLEHARFDAVTAAPAVWLYGAANPVVQVMGRSGFRHPTLNSDVSEATGWQLWVAYGRPTPESGPVAPPNDGLRGVPTGFQLASGPVWTVSADALRARRVILDVSRLRLDAPVKLSLCRSPAVTVTTGRGEPVMLTGAVVPPARAVRTLGGWLVKGTRSVSPVTVSVDALDGKPCVVAVGNY
jgi:hypothetical protein